MSKADKDRLIAALVEFCIKVAKGNATHEKEIEALPKVAEMLLRLPVARKDD